MNQKTKEQQQHQRRIFCSVNSLTALSRLLKTDRRKILLLAKNPPYKTFSIPKKEGGERLIEDPNPTLKVVLGKLNRYLQSVYYFEKSRAAFGFIFGVRNDEDRRNVVTNARKHTGKKYLLNIDLKDFFHTIPRQRVLDIFQNKPFNFKGELAEVLADLTTYNGRLPMGAPTSPVLSNLACRALDKDLTDLSSAMLWTYTRYADDMSFSANLPFHAEKINTLRTIIHNHRLIINERKVKTFGPDEDKIVTGLLVTDKVSLAPNYLPLLKQEIQQLSDVFKIQNEQGQLSTKWVDKFKQQVRGRLNFAGVVLRRNDATYQALKDEYYTAINPPPEEFGAISWRGFPYNL